VTVQKRIATLLLNNTQAPLSRIIRCSVAVFSLCFAFSSVASTIELDVTGTVTASGFASVPVGTPLTAFLYYDPAAPPLGAGAYPQPQAEIFEFGGGSALTAPAATGQIVEIINNSVPGFQGVPIGYDAIYWIETSPTVTGPLASDPNLLIGGTTSLELLFAAPHSDGVLTSGTLPNTFPSLAQWTIASFDFIPVFGGSCASGTCASFSGTVDSVVQVTPEPATGLSAPLALTAVLLGYKRIRAKRKTKNTIV
jgi:hypothetical protein